MGLECRHRFFFFFFFFFLLVLKSFISRITTCTCTRTFHDDRHMYQPPRVVSNHPGGGIFVAFAEDDVIAKPLPELSDSRVWYSDQPRCSASARSRITKKKKSLWRGELGVKPRPSIVVSQVGSAVCVCPAWASPRNLYPFFSFLPQHTFKEKKYLQRYETCVRER